MPPPRPSVAGQPTHAARRRRPSSPAPRAALLMMGVLLWGLGGCARSPWAESLQPAGPFGDAALLSPTARGAPAGGGAATDVPVEVREITWDRMAALLDEEDAAFTATDIHPSDWGAARALEHRAMLLQGLQVQGDPASIEILGRSAFRAIGSVRPLGADREALVRQARRIGATDVVVATTYLGRIDTIVERPVTSFGSGFGYDWYGRRAVPRSRLRSTTVWVPVRTEADQVGVVAFYLRRTGASD